MSTAAELREKAEEIVLPISGMSCAACVFHVEKALRETPGVVSAQVNLLAHQANVTFRPGVGATERMVEAVREAGYEASLPLVSHATDAIVGEAAPDEVEGDRLGLRAGIALTAAVVAMMASMPLMMGEGADPLLGWASRLMMPLMPAALLEIPANGLRWGLLIATALVMVLLSPETYVRAYAAARHRATNMNTLVAIGTLAAFFYSAFVTISVTFAPGYLARLGLSADVYFEAVLFILAFLLVGAALDGRARQKTMDAVRAFSRLLPSTARVVGDDGLEREVGLDKVREGDRVLVRPGERMPVDGVVVAGSSSIDESLVTGESMPVLREAGGAVVGGTINLDGALTVRATAVGAQSVLAQIARLLAAAQSSRAPMQAMADRASAVFVPAVLGLAVVGFAGWMIFAPDHSFARAFAIAIAVLVIACPCAMGLAVPAALTVGIGRAAQMGILVKGGEALERLAGVDTVALDKTGTLTLGRPKIVAVEFAGDLPDGEKGELLRMAAAIEGRSEHPLGRAVVEHVAGLGIAIAGAEIAEFRAAPGKGIAGEVGGHRVVLGNAAWMVESGIALEERAGAMAGTELLMGVDGQWVLTFVAEDAVRPGAAEAIAALTRIGVAAHMLTGDNAAAAAGIAGRIGIASEQVHAGMLPEGKVEAVNELQRAGRRVAMVGDGINDAAALAQADSGIAIGSGTDLAREAGDVVLGWAGRGASSNVDLMLIPTTIRLARRTTRTMRQNLFWAVAYNAVGIPVAMGVLYPHFHVLLSPVLASAAMALSSTSVLANSLRLKRFSV